MQSSPIMPPFSNQLKVSVAVTTYNHEKYIAQAIESILMQNIDFDYEIVIGDDCSTDNTRDILLDFKKMYPDKIQLLLPEKNTGADSNEFFIKVFQACRSEYVALLDGDDYWTSPHKLQKQVDFLDSHPECSMCFHNAKVFYEDGSRGARNLNPVNQKEILILEDLLAGNVIATSSSMLRRGLLGEFPDWFLKAFPGDWIFFILFARHGNIGYINEVMSMYRIHKKGYMRKFDSIQQSRELIDLYPKINSFLNFQYDESIKKQIALRYYVLASEYEKIGDYESAVTYLEKCIAERSEILEVYLPGVGLTNNRVWSFLKRKLWFYKHPVLYRFVGPVAQAINLFMMLLKMIRLIIIRIGRFVRGKSIGIVTANPNPIHDFSSSSGLGTTTLMWGSLRTKEVEVRVGAPDGPLFQRIGASGKAVTGEWVHDGMVFYLQDVTDGLPLTPANTLDIVKVKVGTHTGFVSVGSDLMFSLIEWGKKKVMHTISRLNYLRKYRREPNSTLKSIENINILAVEHCTNACQYCSTSSPFARKVSHPASSFFPWLDLLESERIPFIYISITGGEPFLHPDLGAFIHALRERYPSKKIGVTTNFYWANENTIRLYAPIIQQLNDRLYISLYGNLIAKLGGLERFNSLVSLLRDLCPEIIIEVGKRPSFVSWELHLDERAVKDTCITSDCYILRADGKISHCSIGVGLENRPEYLPIINLSKERLFDLSKGMDGFLSWASKYPFDLCSHCTMWRHISTPWRMDRERGRIPSDGSAEDEL
jgi:glycosyltransferase involved in cell wall biosynthesis